MRIIHFLNHTYSFNGHVNVAVDLACVQTRMGHAVALISEGGHFDDLLDSYGVEHIRIDQKRCVGTIVRALGQLRRAVKAFRPDIIHAHMMTSTGLAFLLRPFMGFQLVTTVHNEFEKSAILMGLGNRVVAVSQAVADSMARRGIPKSKLRVVLNGTIGSPRLSLEPPPAKVLHHPAVLFVGGLHPRKGLDDLIAAFKIVASQVPGAHLYLVGGGPFEKEYRAAAAETGFGDRIEFCGQQRDPRSYFRGADLFVLASHAEPAGLVLVEAREAGCAVIATAVGGMPEMIEQGRAGLLVPVHAPEQLAKAMLAVLSDNRVLADLKKRAAMNLDNYTVDRVAGDYLKIYSEVAKVTL